VRYASAAALAIVIGASGAGACARSPAAPVQTPLRAETRACRHELPACVRAPPTYENDVRPILERHCFKCHAGDGVATDEHDFSHLETLRAQRGALVSEIRACAMPPSGEPTLPAPEAEVLLRWGSCSPSVAGPPENGAQRAVPQ
jgi:hypothetical protein